MFNFNNNNYELESINEIDRKIIYKIKKQKIKIDLSGILFFKGTKYDLIK